MYQEVELIGRLVADPDSRYLPNGQRVTNIRLAINEGWTDESGDKQERTTWWRVAAWGRLAEVTNEYLSKGRTVMVKGTPRTDPETGGPRVYKRNDGTYGAAFELNARLVKFIDGKNAGTVEEGDVPAGDEDDSIPF